MTEAHSRRDFVRPASAGFLFAAPPAKLTQQLETTRQAPAQRQFHDAQAMRIRGYVEEHVTRQIWVKELSALVQLSVPHFTRVFKRTFGQSPYAFVKQQRVGLAMALMTRTKLPLCEIALRCGFADQSHFCRSFSRALGQSPAAWRQMPTKISPGATAQVANQTIAGAS